MRIIHLLFMSMNLVIYVILSALQLCIRPQSGFRILVLIYFEKTVKSGFFESFEHKVEREDYPLVIYV